MISNLSIILLQILLETKISVLSERKKNKHESLFGLHRNYIATRIALYGWVACFKKNVLQTKQMQHSCTGTPIWTRAKWCIEGGVEAAI